MANLDTVKYAKTMYTLALEDKEKANMLVEAISGLSASFKGNMAQTLQQIGEHNGRFLAFRLVGDAMHRFNVTHGLCNETFNYDGKKSDVDAEAKVMRSITTHSVSIFG